MISYTGPKGFTVIEIVVVAAVLAIVALIGIIQIRSLSPEQTLENGTDDTRSLLVLARSYAQTGHVCCNSQLPNGYGVMFDLTAGPTATARLYADLDSSNDFTSGGSDETINSFSLPTDVTFTSCTFGGASITAGVCDLFFLGGRIADLYANGTLETGSFDIALEHVNVATSTSLSVTSLGVIE
jgi:prepilin-type N-terminal cleavage/methylation domain-containing protein